MSPTEAKRLFDGLVCRCVEPMGFTRQTALVFVQPSDETKVFLLFQIRKDPRGYFAATGSIALHFKRLAPLIEGSSPNQIHLNVPFHLLGTERTFHEFHFSDAVHAEAMADDFAEVMSNCVMPWINEFGNLHSLCTRLSSSNPKDWFVLSAEQKTLLLAGLRWVLGDESLARSTVHESLSELENAMPSKRTPLERLQKKIG